MIAPPSRSRGARISDSARRPKKLMPRALAAPSVPDTPATLQSASMRLGRRATAVSIAAGSDRSTSTKGRHGCGGPPHVQPDHIGTELPSQLRSLGADA